MLRPARRLVTTDAVERPSLPLPAVWYAYDRGRERGPFELREVADLLEDGGLTRNARVCGPGIRWTPVTWVDAIGKVFAESALRRQGWSPAPAPEPDEPWFFPVSQRAVTWLQIASAGCYGPVWRYRHSQWLRRRRGLPTTSILDALSDTAELRLEIALAADQVGVPRTFAFRALSSDEYANAFARFASYVRPLLWLSSFLEIQTLQHSAGRVNHAVAPRAERPRLGIAEALAMAVGLSFWGFFGLACLAGVLVELLR